MEQPPNPLDPGPRGSLCPAPTVSVRTLSRIIRARWLADADLILGYLAGRPETDHG